MTDTAGTSLAAGFLITTLGGVMVYSALTGTGIADVLAGKKQDTLDARGGSRITIGGTSAGADAAAAASGDDLIPGIGGGGLVGGGPTGGKSYGFAGPSAALLESLARAATDRFNLRITSTFGGNHVSGSYHFKRRAFDCAGSEADMRAYARYVLQVNEQTGGKIMELIHNPGPCIKNGRVVNGNTIFAGVWEGHRDHDHVAA